MDFNGLELLARFELATSSLPTILEQFLPCVACRKLLDKTLVCQRLFGFACCSLLWLAVGVLCLFFMTRVGFVSVSTAGVLKERGSFLCPRMFQILLPGSDLHAIMKPLFMKTVETMSYRCKEETNARIRLSNRRRSS